MIKFERVKKYKDDETIMIPRRSTENAAGYDFAAAEDITIQPYYRLISLLSASMPEGTKFTLSEMEKATRVYGARPALVSTGIKCKLPKDKYLELSVRSSTPLKYLIMMANSQGIIDSDYYGNESNDGEIFFQLINFSPYPIEIRKGDIIGQGIIKNYYKTDDDEMTTKAVKRTGGFGSTDAAVSPLLMSAT